MIMKSALTIALLAVLVAGCSMSTQPAQQSRPVLLWRGDSGVRLDDVSTPVGFKISPAQAVGGILAEMELKEWAIPYLLADDTFYYFGFDDERAMLPVLTGHNASLIHGGTGEWTRKRKPPNKILHAIDASAPKREN
jgi:hypothetical protein